MFDGIQLEFDLTLDEFSIYETTSQFLPVTSPPPRKVELLKASKSAIQTFLLPHHVSNVYLTGKSIYFYLERSSGYIHIKIFISTK